MDLGLAGRTALVAGSTSGLGLAIAQALSWEEARVVLCGRRAGLAEELAAELPSALGVELDLTRYATVDDAVSRALWVFGAIDVLVLNAGGPPPGPAAELTPESMAAAVETLLLAQIRLVSTLRPAVRGWTGLSSSPPRSGAPSSIPGRSAVSDPVPPSHSNSSSAPVHAELS